MNKKIISWSLTSLFIILPACLYSQVESIRFRHISLQEALSQSTVYAITQDRKGFIWFGTQEGLHRYDGYKVKIFKYDPSDKETISDSIIFCILEDKSNPGTLWIGTRNGLNKFDQKTEKFKRYTKGKSALSHNEVRAIYQGRDGILWIGTKGGGLNRFNPGAETEHFIHYKHDKENSRSLSHDEVTAICEDNKGILWVGTNGGGLSKFNPITEQFTHYKHNESNLKSLSDNHVMVIYEDSNGILWIGTNGGGLNKFDRESGQFESFKNEKNNSRSLSHNEITAICEDSKGILWIGTNGGGLNKSDRESSQFEHFKHDQAGAHSLSNNKILSIYEDESGILWIGNDVGGLNLYNPKVKGFSLYAPKPEVPPEVCNYRDVWAIFEDSSNVVWIGTKGGGLYELERRSGKFIQSRMYYEGGLDDVRAICEDHEGGLWFGTAKNGLKKLIDRKNYKFENYDTNNGLSNNNVKVIFKDQSGVLWVGTADGLNKLDQKSKEFKIYRCNNENKTSTDDDWIACIFEGQQNIIWIGTRGGGVKKFNRNKEIFTSIYKHNDDNEKSLSHNFVLCIYQDKKGTLWVGTLGGGLNKMFNKEEGEFEYIGEKDGLPSNVVYGILEDSKGNLWLSTNKGISKFNPEKGTFKNYDFFDGLQCNEFSQGAYFQNKNGEMFFGGIKGFNAFLPGDIQDDLYVPQVAITDFLIANKSVPIQREETDIISPLQNSIIETDQITLTYKQNFFSFEFAALHYANPHTNQYKYRLNGYYVKDKDTWITTDAKNRRATYTDLPAGDYVFTVKGSNSDGIWREEGKSIKIKILPPPWATWWAYTLYVFAFAVVLYLAWRAWSARFLMQRVEVRTKELKNAQSQLVQSEKMVALGTLLAGIAHEINNPASFARTGAYNLKQDLKELKKFLIDIADDDIGSEVFNTFDERFDNLFKHLNTINEGTIRIRDIVKDLKIVSREEKEEMKNFLILKGLNSTTNLVKTQYKDQIDFIFNFKGNPEIVGNSTEINKVFMNVLVNACQSILERKTYEGDDFKGILNIKVREDKDYAVICIRDNGVGMSENVRNRIFEPFFTTKPEGKGIGLGLYSSYGIIKKHGGRIDVESEEDNSTIVTLYLPLAKKELSATGGR